MSAGFIVHVVYNCSTENILVKWVKKFQRCGWGLVLKGAEISCSYYRLLGCVHILRDKITYIVNGKMWIDVSSHFITSSVTVKSCRVAVSCISSHKLLDIVVWQVLTLDARVEIIRHFRDIVSCRTRTANPHGEHHSMTCWRRMFIIRSIIISSNWLLGLSYKLLHCW